MKKLSKGEETLAWHLKSYKISYEREYAFAKPRKWRADFAILDMNLLIEIEGGTWSRAKSGHTSGASYAKDCEKYNAAAIMGYVVLRYTTDMVLDGRAINQIRDYINKRPVDNSNE